MKEQTRWYRVKELRQENAFLRAKLRELNATPDNICTPSLNIKDKIINTLLDHFKITLEQLIKKDNRRTTSAMRYMLCHLLYNESIMTYTDIGRLLGRDHSTIINAVECADDMLNPRYGYASFIQDYELIKSKI